MKLLIVDDDISAIDVISSAPVIQDSEITEIFKAYNGEKAKDIIRTELPELIICDIEMPICNGIDLLHWIRENEIDTQIIFLTCFSKFEYAQEGIEYGVSSYLTKPINYDKLSIAIKKTITQINKERSDKEIFLKSKRITEASMSLVLQVLSIISEADGFDLSKRDIFGKSDTWISFEKYYMLLIESHDSINRETIRHILNSSLDRPLDSDSYLIYTLNDHCMISTVVSSGSITNDNLYIKCLDIINSLRNNGVVARIAISTPCYISYYPTIKKNLENLITAQDFSVNPLLVTDISQNDYSNIQVNIVSTAEKYIKEHYFENISRNDLARIVFVSPSHLSRIFSRQTGLSIREYINNIRITEAKRLLLETEKNITEISEEVGFESASYFSTVFCKYASLSPIAWKTKEAQILKKQSHDLMNNNSLI